MDNPFFPTTIDWRRLMSLLGKIAYHGWYRPYGFCRDFFRETGFVHVQINEYHGRRLRRAMLAQSPLPVPAGNFHAAHFLTGRTFWHLSALAAYTLQQHSGGAVQPVFHSDGRLDEPTIAHLRRLFPAARFVTDSDQRALLDRHLPAHRFPTLRGLWPRFVLLRKLVSVHAGREGWNLFLDSDTVFVHRPDFLLAWLARPDAPVCMQDMADAYGYDRALLDRLAGHPLPPKVNTGLIGLHSPSLDWPRLELYARELLASKGIDHFLEQAMTAMLLAGRPFHYAPPADYFIPTDVASVHARTGCFHHYAGPARKWFYRLAWQYALTAPIS
jgi:hypothetical protein